MPSLTEKFDRLKKHILAGRELDHASHEPIYYLIFPPKQILEVKHRLTAWEARLKNDGWHVHKFSMAQAIDELLEDSPLMKFWIKEDKKEPLNWGKTNKSIENYLSDGKLTDMLREKLHQIKEDEDAILFVTDIEALHPYLRIGAIESSLIGEFKRPTVIFYPGESTGKTNLKFLGFYSEDGNYRSVHIA